MTRRIEFGCDNDGFFPVLMEGDRGIARLASELDSHRAMLKGMAWARQEHIAADVVRVDTRLLGRLVS